MRLADPPFLLLGLLFLPALLARRKPHLGYSTLALFGDAHHVPVWARFPGWAIGLGIGLLLIALARPQWGQAVELERREARAIILAIDLSGSMQSSVGTGGRTKIDRAKEAALRFVERRQGDRVGLFVFGNETYGSWPLSTDLPVIREKIRALQPDLGGTDLARPLRAALAHVQDLARSQAKAVILVTDGEAAIPAGLREEIQTEVTAMNVHLHLVGIDLPDSADIVDLVNGSGGRVWRIDDAEELWGPFQEIDRLEPSLVTVETRRVRRDLHPWFTLGGLACLSVAVLGASLAPRVP